MSVPFRPPGRGVGLVYTPRLHELFLELASDIAVAEIEPQTAWSTSDSIDGVFAQLEPIAALWAELPQLKYLHSVAMPLAGLRRPNPSQIEVLRDLVARFDPPYVSEHLSVGGTPHQNAGFLLPPRQTTAGIANAVRNVRRLSEGIGRPIAVETGVSYLPPYPGEVPDGDYVRAVAEGADCGILFDIHNVYCNQRNGRQSLMAFAEALPPERVWELHIAGGMEREGYWLDAHSGEPPAELVAAARRIVRGLPCLSTIVFEIYPAYLGEGSDTMILRSLDVARLLWDEAGKSMGDGILHRLEPVPEVDFGPDDLAHWESLLTEAVRFSLPVALGADLSMKPAISLYHNLAHSFRSSSVARLMSRSLRLLAMCGEDFEALLWDYERDVAPPLFALNEATAFREWVLARRPGLHPGLPGLLDFELALASVPITGKPATVHFEGDPQPLFQALAEGTGLPEALTGPPWEIEITPDQAETPGRTAALAS